MNADTSDSSGSDDPPNFDAWEDPDSLFRDRPIRGRILDVVVQIRTPMPVAEIAERVDCDTETARDYLAWFARMGVVTEQSGRPVRYEANRSYLRWRRIERLRRRHTDDELVAELERAITGLREFRERFDASDPEEVSLLTVADESDSKIGDVWEELVTWKTIRKRAELLDAARGDTAANVYSLRADG